MLRAKRFAENIQLPIPFIKSSQGSTGSFMGEGWKIPGVTCRMNTSAASMLRTLGSAAKEKAQGLVKFGLESNLERHGVKGFPNLLVFERPNAVFEPLTLPHLPFRAADTQVI